MITSAHAGLAKAYEVWPSAEPTPLAVLLGFTFRFNAQKQLWTELSRLADSKNKKVRHTHTHDKTRVPAEIRLVSNLQINMPQNPVFSYFDEPKPGKTDVF